MAALAGLVVLAGLVGCGGGDARESELARRPATTGTTGTDPAPGPQAPGLAQGASPGASAMRAAHAPARLRTGAIALAATSDGAQLLAADRSAARVRLLQRADGRVLREWGWPASPSGPSGAPSPSGAVFDDAWVAAAVSADAGVLLAARRDSTLELHMLEGLAKGAAARQVWRGHGQPLRAVAVSADGRRAASAGDDARVLWWDVPGARLLRSLAATAGIVDALALSADAAWLASGGADGQVRVWDTELDRLVLRLDLQAGAVRALAFASGSPAWLACASADGTVTVWDLSSRSLVQRLASPAAVVSLGFAGTAARVLVAGTDDGRLLSWPLTAVAGALR